MTAAARAVPRLPAGVWALGVVSFFMDGSSELIHSLLPVFLVGTLGASAAALGWIEGLAEGLASLVKFFSGVASDRLARRKTLVVIGYALAALSKPLFPLAGGAGAVLAARLIDRTGKGIRGAPRDALVADLTDERQRGAAFGLRQALDTAGAVGGPLAAVALMIAFAGEVRAVLWFALIPAALAVLVLLVFVREPARRMAPSPRTLPRWAALRALPAPLWMLLVATAPFTLARFSEAFLLLRAQGAGLADAKVPLVLATMSAAYAASAYPAGRLSDRVPRGRLLVAGCGVLVVADLCLAAAPSLAWIFGGAVLWGLHMGLTEGLVAALVADRAPPAQRGAAFGLLHLQRGVLLLAASVLAGLLWQHAGAAATFGAGAALAAAGAIALLAARA
ncbi:MAG TPA: MFS transporter [Candidatus Binatia bacterium]|nr:MFS transporter [Candidatus Binatia bacterium]